MKKVPIKAVSRNMPSVKDYAKAVKGQHVTPREGDWQVKKAGSKKATKVFSTQKEAICHARNIAKNQQAELFVHARSGKIRSRDSYGRDPFPPRG